MTYEEIVQKYTDPIREALMGYIYSDNDLDDALYIEKILSDLRCIEGQMTAYERKLSELEVDKTVKVLYKEDLSQLLK